MATGLLFSGQGAQFVGMGRSLYENSEIARSLYDEANAVLGWDLKKVSFEGPDEALTETSACQPALYVHGYAVFRILESQGKLDDLVAACGLSLGELTALAAAGVYDFATGLRLVAERGRLMQEACNETQGGMASVIGGDPEAVETLCQEFDIEIANFNCPGQIVISGEEERILDAVANSRDRGFKLVKPLKVAGAYHSRLMKSAREAFAQYIEDFTFEKPKLAVYTNVTGNQVTDPEAIKEALISQVVSSVRFEDCLRNAAQENNVDNFYECGPNKILAGLARRTDRELSITPVSEFEELPA
ncbi:MAG: ACP S-malonyltransferase [Coraliomargaritaceae bacterium]